MDNQYLDNALSKMRSPFEMGIICIDITNRCDLKCSNCTRLLANQNVHYDMSLDNFRQAVRSLKDYPGIIAIIGGNPCLHREFESICRIFNEEITNKDQRGLWTNNLFQYKELAKTTFGVFNLNPHNDPRGIASLEDLKNQSWYHPGNSEHSSLLAAVKDFYPPDEMWERISQCDINQNWSASIIEHNGNLRAYFCEVAASFDLARDEDHGHPVEDGWWKKSVRAFSDQVSHFCPSCGIPARIGTRLDKEETDTYSVTNKDIAELSARTKKRKIIEIKPENLTSNNPHVVTQYSRSLQKKKLITVITPYYKEPIDVLKQCHESVLNQTVDAEVKHIMIADGFPKKSIDSWNVDHLKLPRPHMNNGNTPRAIGALLAEAESSDFIAFLDADNWFHSEHLKSLLELHFNSNSPVVCSWRTYHKLDGTPMNAYEGDENNYQHVDTSCYLLHRKAYSINKVWSQMPNAVSMICDRIFYRAILKERFPVSFSGLRTVAFRSDYMDHYRQVGEEPPQSGIEKNLKVDQAWSYLMSAEGVSATVDKLGFWPPGVELPGVINNSTGQLPEDFNQEKYLELNFDVYQSGMDPVEHYLNFGIHEQRRYK